MDGEHLTHSHKPICKLIGEDGNIFNLLAIASRTLRDANQSDNADLMRARVYACSSYEEALGIIGDYVEII